MSGLRRGRPAPPVRVVHLGLGSFFRAHQAAFTGHARDADAWGIAAFSGRRTDLAAALREQDGLYTLVTRAPEGDVFEVVGAVARALPGADHESWLSLLASPRVSVVTMTVTEAGYCRAPGGGLDATGAAVVRDVAALRADPRAAVATAPARLLAGLLARRAADAGPLSVVPCDNLAGNGRAVRRVLGDLVQLVEPRAESWLATSLSTVDTVVDRITPAGTPEDAAVVLAGTGVSDRCPVVTEPFAEWVLSGDFPAGRPAWETAGAVMTGDITPYEQRKLWLLNGGHSLLAYLGLARGHATIAEAVADDVCRGWLEAWWSTCEPHLEGDAEETRRYVAALLERFANPRMRHSLRQIATDGSQKLAVRLLPVLRAERRADRLPPVIAAVLAAWILQLRGGSPAPDARAAELAPLAARPPGEAVRALLTLLEPALGDHPELVTLTERLVAGGPPALSS